jgi:hypothetical protein
MANRAKILGSLYTIMLGNQQFVTKKPPKTRFKDWWHLIGSGIEHAAGICGEKADFKDLFLVPETTDVDVTTLGDALTAMERNWPERKRFTAGQVAKLINSVGGEGGFVEGTTDDDTVRDCFFPTDKEFTFSAKKVGVKLTNYIGQPVMYGEEVLILKGGKNTHTNSQEYWVERIKK